METEPDPDEQSVQPAPVPAAFGVAAAPTTDGGSLIVLQAQTPVGTAIYFLEPAAAVQVGNALRAAGKAGLSRLATPRTGLIVPGAISPGDLN